METQSLNSTGLGDNEELEKSEVQTEEFETKLVQQEENPHSLQTSVNVSSELCVVERDEPMQENQSDSEIKDLHNLSKEMSSQPGQHGEMLQEAQESENIQVPMSLMEEENERSQQSQDREVNELKKELLEKEEQISSSQKSVEKIRGEKLKVELNLLEMEGKMEALKNGDRIHLQKQEELMEKIFKLEDLIQEQRANATSKETENEALNSSLFQARNTISELNTALEEGKSKIEACSGNEIEFHEKIANLKKELLEKEVYIEKLKVEVDDKEKNLSETSFEYEKILKEKTNDIQSLKDKLDCYKQVEEDLKGKLNIQNTSIQQKESEWERLKNDFEMKLKDTEVKMKEYEIKFEQMKQDSVAMKVYQESSIKFMETEKVLKQSITEKEHQIEKITQTNEALMDQIVGYDLKLSKLKEEKNIECERLKDEMDNLMQSNTLMEKELSESAKTVVESDKLIKVLQEENNNLSLTLREANENITQLRASIEKLRLNIVESNSECQEAKALNNSIYLKVSEMESQYEVLKEELKEKEYKLSQALISSQSKKDELCEKKFTNLEELKLAVETFKKENKLIEEEAQQTDVEVEEILSDNNKEKEEKKQLLRQIQEFQEQRKNLEESEKILKNELKEKESQILAFEKAATEVQEQNDYSFEQQMRTLKELEEDLKHHKELYNSTKNENLKLLSTTNELKAELSRLRDEKKALGSDFESYKDIMNLMRRETDYQENCQNCQTIEDQYHNIDRQNSILLTTVSRLTRQINLVRQRNLELCTGDRKKEHHLESETQTDSPSEKSVGSEAVKSSEKHIDHQGTEINLLRNQLDEKLNVEKLLREKLHDLEGQGLSSNGVRDRRKVESNTQGDFSSDQECERMSESENRAVTDKMNLKKREMTELMEELIYVNDQLEAKNSDLAKEKNRLKQVAEMLSCKIDEILYLTSFYGIEIGKLHSRIDNLTKENEVDINEIDARHILLNIDDAPGQENEIQVENGILKMSNGLSTVTTEELETSKVRVEMLQDDLKSKINKDAACLRQIQDMVETQNKHLKENISRLTSEINDIEVKGYASEYSLQTKDATIKELSMQADNLSKELKEMKCKLGTLEEERNEFLIEFEKLKTINKESEEMITELKEKLNGSDKEKEEAVSKYNELQSQLEGLQKHDKNLQHLQLVNDSCKADLIAKEETIKEINIHLNNLKKELDETKCKLCFVENERNEFQIELEKLKREKETSTTVASGLEQNVIKLSKSQEKTFEKCNELEVHLKELKEEYDKQLKELQSVNDARESDLIAKDENLEEMSVHVSNLTKELDEMKLKFSSLEKEKNKLQKELKKVCSENKESLSIISNYEEKLSKSDQEKEETTAKYNELESQLKELKEEHNKKLYDLQALKDACESDSTAKEENIREMSIHVNKLTKERDEMKLKFCSLEEEKNKLQKELEKVCSENKELVSIISNYEEKLSKSDKEKEETAAKYSEIESLLKELKEEQNKNLYDLVSMKDACLSDSVAKEESIREMSVQANNLTKELDEVKQKFSSLEEEKNKLQNEFEKLCREKEELISVNSDIEEKLAKSDTEKDEALGKCNELESRLEQLTQEYIKDKEDLKSLNVACESDCIQLRKELQEATEIQKQVNNEKENILMHIKEKEHIIRTKETDINNLTIQLKESEDSNIELKETLENYKVNEMKLSNLLREYEEIKSKVEEAETKIKHLEEENSASKEKIKSVIEENTELNILKAELWSKINDLESKIEEKKKEVEKKDICLVKKGEELDALQTKLSLLETDLRENQKQTEKLNIIIDEKKSVNSLLESTCKDVNSKFNELQIKFEQVTSEMVNLGQSLNTLQEEKASLMLEKEAFSQQLCQSTKDKDLLTDELSGHKMSYQELKNKYDLQLEEHRSEMADLKKKLESKETTLEENRKEVEKSRDNLREAKREAEAKAEEINLKNVELDKARDSIKVMKEEHEIKLKECNTIIEEAKDDLENLKAKFNLNQSVVHKKEKELNVKQKLIEKLNSKLKTLNEKVKRASVETKLKEDQLAQTKEEIATLQKKVEEKILLVEDSKRLQLEVETELKKSKGTNENLQQKLSKLQLENQNLRLKISEKMKKTRISFKEAGNNSNDVIACSQSQVKNLSANLNPPLNRAVTRKAEVLSDLPTASRGRNTRRRSGRKSLSQSSSDSVSSPAAGGTVGKNPDCYSQEESPISSPDKRVTRLSSSRNRCSAESLTRGLESSRGSPCGKKMKLSNVDDLPYKNQHGLNDIGELEGFPGIINRVTTPLKEKDSDASRGPLQSLNINYKGKRIPTPSKEAASTSSASTSKSSAVEEGRASNAEPGAMLSRGSLLRSGRGAQRRAKVNRPSGSQECKTQ